MTLYELQAQYQQVLDMAESCEYDEQTIIDTLESIQGDIEDKAENYAIIMKSLEADANGLDEEEKRLRAKRTSIENKITYMKKSLEDMMIFTGKKKFKTKLFSFGIQKNPPVVEVFASVPKKYLIPQPDKINNAKIKQDLKDGKNLDFAILRQTESLRIR